MNTDWTEQFRGVGFSASNRAIELLNTFVADLDVDVTDSGFRAERTQKTWHVHYKGVRILAIDISRKHFQSRFLKMHYAPNSLVNHPLLSTERWNRGRTNKIKIDSIERARELRLVLAEHLQIISDALDGVRSDLPKPEEESARLREHYFEDELERNLERLESGLTLVRRQLVIPEGRIDILCKNASGNPTVLELKTGDGNSNVIPQLQFYIDYIQSVTGLVTSGIVVTQDSNIELQKCCIDAGLGYRAWNSAE